MTVSPSSKASSSQQKSLPSSSIPPPSPSTKSAEEAFLTTVEGEISFFRSIMRARPVGQHRHFHVLAIQNAIQKDTGRLLHVESLWDKLQSCYDLDVLEAIEREAEGSNSTSPVAVRSPSPSENLARHPFFKDEYTLPFDETLDNLISQRRIRATASAPSSPVASPTPVSAPTKSQRKAAASSSGGGSGRRRARSKADLAGLVGGDSDSSALTQESGDEAVVGTPQESVVTGTDADGGTEPGEDEDVEMREPSPARSVSPKPQRGRPKGVKKGRGRPSGSGTTTTTRSSKKRKR
ncbi:hypothetical protein P691DRAFT_812758 [Macrolepiota fuliginosa MF-IS2]|uniref:Chromatin modification-related protein EAF7 n=1 Tax=Macrolepiota fuliginosa MF-IS2 TaxID=1400762 RepID=A0A9P5X0Q5_9AGAR|nr:hypothetical protein P691DRAFT_812758 [Macrolepiota fuliginosa MF-IS2]